MDGEHGQVNVVEQLVVELDGHAGAKEHHHLLLTVLLEECEQQQEAFLTRAHHVAWEHERYRRVRHRPTVS